MVVNLSFDGEIKQKWQFVFINPCLSTSAEVRKTNNLIDVPVTVSNL